MNTQKKVLAIAMAIATLTVASCGGGSSSNSTATTTVQGKVLDGYIANATVCLDLNKNFRCDDGEPTTTSDATGSYVLSFEGSATDKVILAQAGYDAKDVDDGGKTLDEVGRTTFTLAAPATQASVISPLTTMVTLDLLTNINAAMTDSAIAASEKKVQIALNNSDPIMGVDFVKSGNKQLHELASVITAALSEAYPIAYQNTTQVLTQTIVDTNLLKQTGYQSMRDGIYAALAVVVDTTTHDALKYPLVDSRRYVVTAVDFLEFTGSSTATTMQLKLPPRSYLDDTTVHASACPSNMSDLDCFVRQEFLN